MRWIAVQRIRGGKPAALCICAELERRRDRSQYEAPRGRAEPRVVRSEGHSDRRCDAPIEGEPTVAVQLRVHMIDVIGRRAAI